MKSHHVSLCTDCARVAMLPTKWRVLKKHLIDTDVVTYDPSTESLQIGAIKASDLRSSIPEFVLVDSVKCIEAKRNQIKLLQVNYMLTEERDIMRLSFVSTSLQVLILKNCAIGDEGCRAFSSYLIMLRAIKHLNLSGNCITDNGASSLSGALSCLSAMQNLDLSNNRIGDDGIVSLSTALSFMMSRNHHIKS